MRRFRSSAPRRCMRAGISSENSSSSRSGMIRPSAGGGEPGLAAGLGEFADAQDVALPLGDRDDAARIEQIEDMAGLDALVIGRQGQPVLAPAAVAPARLAQPPALGLRLADVTPQHL